MGATKSETMKEAAIDDGSRVNLWQMNLDPLVQSEESSKVKKLKKKLYINAYIQNLEKWYCGTYFQGSNRDPNMENRLEDSAGEGVSTKCASVVANSVQP